MAGHNKWSQIKHKKAKEDAKKGKAFTKLLKEITVTARDGGGDPAHNAHLRLLLEKGKMINMPQDNAIRAIKKGTGELPGVNYQEYLYEGYGPHGIAVVVETLTDNKNRTVAGMRKLFSSNNGNLGESGSVSWMFAHLGVIRVTKNNTTEDQLFELLLDHDPEDIRDQDEYFTISCDPKKITEIKEILEKQNLTIESAGLEWVAKNTTELSDEHAEKVLSFLSELDDHEDVQNVYTNLA